MTRIFAVGLITLLSLAPLAQGGAAERQLGASLSGHCGGTHHQGDQLQAPERVHQTRRTFKANKALSMWKLN